MSILKGKEIKQSNIVIGKFAEEITIASVRTLPRKEGYNENIVVGVLMEDNKVAEFVVGKAGHENLTAGAAMANRTDFSADSKFGASSKITFVNIGA